MKQMPLANLSWTCASQPAEHWVCRPFAGDRMETRRKPNAEEGQHEHEFAVVIGGQPMGGGTGDSAETARQGAIVMYVSHLRAIIEVMQDRKPRIQRATTQDLLALRKPNGGK